MKFFLLISLFIVGLLGCKYDCHKTISDFLKTKIINPQSLQGVTILQVDTILTTYADTKQYQKDKMTIDSLMDQYNANMDKAKSYIGISDATVNFYEELANEAYSPIPHIMKVDSARIRTYKGVFSYYWVRASYQALDSDGQLKTDTSGFKLNKNMSRVLDSSDINL